MIFNFSTTHGHAIAFGYYYFSSQVMSLDNLEFDTIVGKYLDTAKYGYLLDNSIKWYKTSNILKLNVSTGTFTSSANYGIFKPINNYLAFRKILPYDTLYGWFLIDLPIGLNSGIKIKSWAYKKLYLSINEINKENETLLVYPNPANEVVYVDAKVPVDRSTRINIVNCLAEEINSNYEIQSDQKIKLNVSALRSGIYFIEFQNKNAIIRKKIIISR